MKRLNINFISLFRYAHTRIANCDNLRFRDVALYYSLLQCWNKYRFPELLSINRQELLRFSKIGSHNTYLASLNNLARNNFIKYYPSRDISKGSTVSFCVELSVVCQNMTQQRHDSDTEVRHSINSSKQEQIVQTPKKKEVVKFFIANKSSKDLALKFFNLNESFAWKYKEQPISNWKSFAENYINRSNSSGSSKRSSKKIYSADKFDCGDFKTYENGK